MYLFNPDHDLALADFSPHYTPPASAVRMAEELSLLPVWYAGEGVNPPLVIAEGEVNRSFLDAVKQILPLHATLIPFTDVALYPRRKIIPWGWNPALRRKLTSHGADGEALPSPEELARLREYSNRLHAVEILRELRSEEERFCGESRFFTDTEELYAWLQSVPGNKVLKMPLSGSGKGLIWILGEITGKQRDRCRRIVREQGGIAAEPVLTVKQDFAMEFHLHAGEARFAAYSLFSASSSGAYTGNELLDDARIEAELCRYVPAGLLHQLKASLAEKLSRRFPSYSGCAGVDMMICKTAAGAYRLQPCVEINMRMNMGMAAHLFCERHISAGAKGKFTVNYFKKPGSALSFHEKMRRESPLTVENGKILSGYLSLTPVVKTTRYIACANVLRND